jgi:glutathione synthase/RimK-type ligase-like ATP-grasp enzyme
MDLYMLPYSYYSESARDLAGLLEARLVNKERPTHVESIPRSALILNWGTSIFPNQDRYEWLNIPDRIRVSNNKLSALRVLKDSGIQTPDFTTSREVAERWVAHGVQVFCRTMLSGHSGAGIVPSVPNTPLEPAPLYVKYVKKVAEYRVHVMSEEVIDVQEKRKINGFGEVNTQIRTHANGWVYCRESVTEDVRLRTLAIACVRALGLMFGAVDIIYNRKEDKYYPLEVNSAPGLEGETLFNYASAFYLLQEERKE